MPRYAPQYLPEDLMTRRGIPERDDELEPVEDFRQTFDMKSFTRIYQKMLGIANFLQRGLGSAMGEARRRRNLYGEALGSLISLQDRAPRRRTREIFGQLTGEPEALEEPSELPGRAEERVEPSPFGAFGAMGNILERRLTLEEAPPRVRK